eukprot:scaffold13053_cov89-Isochrysis_galbana.AAC.1
MPTHMQAGSRLSGAAFKHINSSTRPAHVGSPRMIDRHDDTRTQALPVRRQPTTLGATYTYVRATRRSPPPCSDPRPAAPSAPPSIAPPPSLLIDPAPSALTSHGESGCSSIPSAAPPCTSPNRILLRSRTASREAPIFQYRCAELTATAAAAAEPTRQKPAMAA